MSKDNRLSVAVLLAKIEAVGLAVDSFELPQLGTGRRQSLSFTEGTIC